ncbi:MAG: hypothetical protein VX294_15770 [Candidatus Latescibacterota bacterium]|nr:hypothetical protein [Candidatus Latescibacterota bacterium]
MLIALCCVVALLFNGCAASYSSYLAPSLNRLAREDYDGALAKIEKPDGLTNKLLYRLERGLILHYQGEYHKSNQEFERAEKIVDRLYTKSLSRSVASLLTNDAIIAYRGEEFERVMIHYYRAMNYERLGDRQSVLVECRKANLKLAKYSKGSEYELSYRNDAFLQYMTGMFFEAEGEWNDAYVSYRLAEKGYKAYATSFNTQMPRMLILDLVRIAERLGYKDDVVDYENRYSVKDEETRNPAIDEIVVFVEVGFVPRKRQIEFELPIYEDDRDLPVWTVSDRARSRYRYPRTYRRSSIDYWLRVALPEYHDRISPPLSVRVRNGKQSYHGVIVEDLEAIAKKALIEKYDHILLRTIARNISKYMASKAIERAIVESGDHESKNDDVRRGVGALSGWVFNIFGSSTEAADTRNWLSLPGQIHVARLPVHTKSSTLKVELLDSNGHVVKVKEVSPDQLSTGSKAFVNLRIFL